jgi:heterodisulfide reductase subunit C
MRVEYSLDVQAKCPVDHRSDFYRCVVRSGVTIPVEHILEAARGFAGRELFQEDLTSELHRALGAEVETVGTHSGVETRVVCGEGR